AFPEPPLYAVATLLVPSLVQPCSSQLATV
ncbi:hypothetical protein A2U01_0106315, partial [Trifolium medium]|nr:hypothetical protein [Trifolium medium]